MPNFIQQLFAASPPPANTAIPAPQTYSPALERKARASGFKSADAMMQWARQRNTPSGGTIPAGSMPSMDAAMAWHPKNILGSVLNSVQGALGY